MMGGDQIDVGLGEGLHLLDRRSAGADATPQRFLDLAQILFEDGVVQVRLALEIVKQGSFLNADFVGDLMKTRAVVSGLGEKVLRRSEDTLARATLWRQIHDVTLPNGRMGTRRMDSWGDDVGHVRAPLTVVRVPFAHVQVREDPVNGQRAHGHTNQYLYWLQSIGFSAACFCSVSFSAASVVSGGSVIPIKYVVMSAISSLGCSTFGVPSTVKKTVGMRVSLPAIVFGRDKKSLIHS